MRSTSKPKKIRKSAKAEKHAKVEVMEAPANVIIDHHTALEIHFEEYEMSRAPGS